MDWVANSEKPKCKENDFSYKIKKEGYRLEGYNLSITKQEII